MIINEVLGNIENPQWDNYIMDILELDWYELNKKILRKVTRNNVEVAISLLQNAHTLRDGDILVISQNSIIVVKVKACECIAIQINNSSHLELARICYEIGNRHAALFIDENDESTLLLAMDKPLAQLLEKIGANPKIVKARLIKSLSASSAKSSSHHHIH